MYCAGDKYRTKNKELKEKSLAKNQEWVRLRENHRAKVRKLL